MKKVLNKITGIVLAAVMTMSALAIGKIDAKAATAINVNQEYRVQISYKQTAEYTFTTPSNAITSVNACIVNSDDSYAHAHIGLTVDYCNYDGMTVYTGDGAKKTEDFVFAPGHTATITLSSVSYDDTVTVAFTVNCTNPGNLEKEKNNYPGAATQIKLKKTYNGMVSYVDSDVDWYVFKAPKTGKYKFYAVNTMTNGYSHVYVKGYKSKTKEDPNFGGYLNSGAGWSKSKSIKLKKGKRYYIKFSNPSYADSVPVQIRVKKVK